MDIKSEIIKILRVAGVTGEIDLTTPPKPEMGDLAFACFNLAKELKMNPVEIAKQLAIVISNPKGEKSLSAFNSSGGDSSSPLKGSLGMTVKNARDDNRIVGRVAAFGPYVNFFLNTGALASEIIPAVANKKYGTNNFGKGKKILVEYPANNTHKEIHVGHLRNICLGNSLIKIFEANGFNIIPINYLNDFGAHVAKCLWGLLKFHKNEKPPANKQRWLGAIYTEASIYLAEHPEAKDEIAIIQNKIEKHDKTIWPLYKTTRQWSIAGFNIIFKELGVRHKTVLYEHEVKEAGQKLVDELLKKGVAQVGEGGAIIVDLNKYNLDIGLLRKSNGLGLYLTSDLGLAQLRNKTFPKIFQSVHLTGIEQNFYFKQLFKILELAGFNYQTKHIGYGLVSTTSGKMSSRLGNVLLYEDLRDEVYEKLLSETAKRHTDWSKKKIATTAHTITQAAIKFEILKHEAEKVIVFDPATAASFDGFTGPYVLYTVARINSIIKKSSHRTVIPMKIGISVPLTSPEEKKLLLLLSQYGEIIQKAYNNYNPSVVIKYTFDLAQAYNEFYNKHSVLQAESKELISARVQLSGAVRTVLTKSLDILGIEVVGEM
ncbi:MAG: arginine--tRNA ligase [Candidatus Magasanikbacteria bacterium RIFOXYC2_FULL_42_28]|uniref:Arginine--tRNA ligase n=1 Tax=Candidatus Magasanikbacteria bacterium RIFOXYC2_FULL_42_28 TaxID=1798704 RepID=A0A1F6NYH1_9BACT|nr:MAG: arginine--tRNA ligase [Candidatus Magasanikbacteria bacterium RIFOXYC2_FULL_42_28]